jgi:hypothetical protein
VAVDGPRTVEMMLAQDIHWNRMDFEGKRAGKYLSRISYDGTQKGEYCSSSVMIMGHNPLNVNKKLGAIQSTKFYIPNVLIPLTESKVACL